MQATKFDPDLGATSAEETPATHVPHTVPKAARRATREFAVASGVLVDASLEGERSSAHGMMAGWQAGVESCGACMHMYPDAMFWTAHS